MRYVNDSKYAFHSLKSLGNWALNPIENRSILSRPLTICAGSSLIAGLLLNWVLEHHSFVDLGVQDPGSYLGGWPDVLLPAVAFFLCFSGLVLFLFTLIPRLRRWSLGERISLTITVSIPLAVLYGAFYLGTQYLAVGAYSPSQCSGLEQAAEASGEIPPSAVVPDQPAIACSVEMYGMFLSDYDDLQIYGVTNSAAQDRILHNLSSYRKSVHTHPLHVGFFEKENWIPWANQKNGARGGQRGPENLIRIVTLR